MLLWICKQRPSFMKHWQLIIHVIAHTHASYTNILSLWVSQECLSGIIVYLLTKKNFEKSKIIFGRYEKSIILYTGMHRGCVDGLSTPLAKLRHVDTLPLTGVYTALIQQIFMFTKGDFPWESGGFLPQNSNKLSLELS